jgi:hypothetical protein
MARLYKTECAILEKKCTSQNAERSWHVHLVCTFTFLGAPATTTVQNVDWLTKCYFISHMMSKCLKLFVWKKV